MLFLLLSTFVNGIGVVSLVVVLGISVVNIVVNTFSVITSGLVIVVLVVFVWTTCSSFVSSVLSSEKRNLNTSKKDESSSMFSLIGSVVVVVVVVVVGRSVVIAFCVVEVCLARNGMISPMRDCKSGAGSVLMTSLNGSGVIMPSATVTGSGMFGGMSSLERTTVGESSSPERI